jgi:NAD(P)-dependent dehydrogenase (short-subunit alcohol dehydrogenase family)
MVTGAARGIGASIVQAALGAGDRVVATGRRIEALAAEHAGQPDVQVVQLDVTVPAQAAAAVQEAVAWAGRIDVLVNNAGYGQLGAFEENTDEEIRRQFDTNVFGLMHVTRAVLPVMRRQRAGWIVNLSSAGGMVPFPSAAVYCTSKFAIEGFSACLALDVAPFGIRVSAIEPGPFRTDFLAHTSVQYGGTPVEDYAVISREARDAYTSWDQQQPGDPDRLARAIVTLADSAEPPHHFVAGRTALERVQAREEGLRAELARWRDLSLATDYAPAEVAARA